MWAEKAQELTDKQKQLADQIDRARKLPFARLSAEQQAARLEECAATAKIGDLMPDSSVYLGILPETNERLYAMPEDASAAMDFNKAAQYAQRLGELGHRDWRLPTRIELGLLYRHQATGMLKDTFDASSTGYYWTSAENGSRRAFMQRFEDGQPMNEFRIATGRVRCVRSVPLKT